MKWSVMALLMLAAAGHAQGAAPAWQVVIEKADTDHDGKVSMEEVKVFPHRSEFLGFQAFMADHFIAFDHDNDGNLTQEELRDGITSIGMDDDQVYNGFLHGFAFMSVQ